MERLTTDKPVSEMTMTELAHNSCYRGGDGNARYRDYEGDMDARQLAIELLKKFTGEPCDFTSSDDFDDDMMEAMQEGFGTMRGVIAVLYEQIWAKAELREYLRLYEDVGLTPERAAKLKENAALLDFFEADVVDGLDKLKEYERDDSQGRLLRMPCKAGDIVYLAAHGEDGEVSGRKVDVIGSDRNGMFFILENWPQERIRAGEIGENYFLTKEEAVKAIGEGGERPELAARLNDSEGVCPVCGNTITYNGGMDRDDAGCTYPWSCDHCGATGGEGFNFVFDRHYNVRDEDGKPIPGRTE